MLILDVGNARLCLVHCVPLFTHSPAGHGIPAASVTSLRNLLPRLLPAEGRLQLRRGAVLFLALFDDLQQRPLPRYCNELS